MESNIFKVLDARGDQGAMEIKSPRNQGLLHSDVDYLFRVECVQYICDTRNHIEYYDFYSIVVFLIK